MTVSHYLYEVQLCINEIGPNIRYWCEKFQRKDELLNRVMSARPDTIIHLAALILFPKAAGVGLVSTVAVPRAVDYIMHLSPIQFIDGKIYDLNLTNIAKKVGTVAIIITTGLIIDHPYLSLLPALFVAKVMADKTLDKYYNRK